MTTANDDDLFTTETAGLPEVSRPDITRLGDGDRLDLRIGPVRKNMDGAELRMLAYNGSIPGSVLHVDQGSQITVQVTNDGDVEATVHWHGLRLENRYDGVPDETQAPIPIGGTFTYQLQFPDAGFYWYHPHIREDFGLEMGLYGTIVVEPADPGYWPAADRQLTLTLDDLLVEDGHIAPFHKSGPTFVAMGRYGNVMLINGETQFSGQAAAGEVVRLYVVNTANTRIFNFAVRGARAKLVGGDSGRYEREMFTDEVLLAPSERAVVDVLFEAPGQVFLEHRTPDRVYDLGAFTVAEGAASGAAGSFEVLRTDPELTAEHQSIGYPSGKPMPHYDVNPGWHDDICDGPVKATVDFTGMPGAPAGVTGVQPAQSAWVVTAAPDFAHALEPVISLYDMAYSIAVTKFSFPSRSAKPSFRHDIYAILHKAMMAHWSVGSLQSLYAIIDFHHFEPASFGDAAFRALGAGRLASLRNPDKTAGSPPQVARDRVFIKLKNPVGASTGNMPLLNRVSPVVAGDVTTITPFHYKLFKQWSVGNFNDDFASPVTPPSQPELLDQAHMKSMVGGGFFPGIEVCSRVRADATWSGPFRIDDSLPPGSLTEKLAIPWQADFYDCRTQGGQEWWPSHRLLKVLPGAAASYANFVDWAPYRGFQDMVDYWNKLGFLAPKTVGGDKLLALSEPPTPFTPP